MHQVSQGNSYVWFTHIGVEVWLPSISQIGDPIIEISYFFCWCNVYSDVRNKPIILAKTGERLYI